MIKTMIKWLSIQITLLTIVFGGILLLTSNAKANDYNTAVIGHVITQKIQGTNINTTAILESEIQRLTYNFAIELINTMQIHMPAILEGIAADMRQQADKEYKEKLLKPKE